MKKLLLCLSLWLGLAPFFTLHAQSPRDIWVFGKRASLRFDPRSDKPFARNPIYPSFQGFEGCSSVVDEQGNLLFYTNSHTIDTRLGEPMTNGVAIGGSSSASQGALAVRAVDNATLYYLFTQDDKENKLQGGMRYSLIDMSLANGLGAVTQRGVRIPIPGGKLVTEHLAAVPQGNGHDYWIVAHGFNTNEFYAFALTKDGLSTTPVISAVGSVFTAATTDQTGLIRFSPNGRQVAVTKLLGGLELFDFDPETGVVNNGARLTQPAASADILAIRTVGIEFSADGSLLYSHEGPRILRFDLLVGSMDQIKASRRQIGVSPRPVGDFLRGPDNRIYIAVFDDSGLSVIERANSVFSSRFVFRGQRVNSYAEADAKVEPLSQWSLPNYRVTPLLSKAVVEEGFAVEGTPACAGQLSSFRAYGRGSRIIRQVTWQFSPDATQYTGLQIAPVFTQAGTREMLANAEFTDGTSLSITFAVTVPPNPNLQLQASTPSPTLVCGEAEVVLTATANTPGTLHWADSPTTEAVRRVAQSGTYRVRFESAAGCVTQDSITVTVPDTGCKLPNIITPNGDGLNQRFVLQNYDAQHWDITIYNRWGRQVFQQTSYRNDWQADQQPTGVYYYHLRHHTTQQVIKGWLEVVR